jgi:putative FmdB family regulatory protein
LWHRARGDAKLVAEESSMPTYEYACKNCGEHLEVVQSFKDEPLTECPACGGTLRKVFAPVGIVLKGSGFYKTDSRSAASKSGAKREKKEASESSSSSSADSSSSSSSSTKSESKTKSESDSGKGKADSKSA